jgi:membrane fusion protein, multidrug efflux system
LKPSLPLPDSLHANTFSLLAAVALLGSCGSAPSEKGGQQGGPQNVGYVVVSATSVPLVTELDGRVAAFQSSEVRPQVAGIIRRRMFTEGAIVRAGQTLYQIDASLYRAASAEALANLASARATAEAARAKAARYRPLAEMEAISKQEYTDALAQSREAAAAVAQNSARLDTAQINLRYTSVAAPISGRIGRSAVTEGALVTANQTDALAVIQRLDPVYVDIQQSSADLLTLRRALVQGGLTSGSAAVELLLEDGSIYPLVGTIAFSEVVVDPETATVTLRARFPNPQGVLLPGMFVRARFVQASNSNAILVPQQAVSRDAKGTAMVFVVGPGNKAVQRTITAERTQGAFWVVTDGLNSGDKVITQGNGRLRPNAPLRAVPSPPLPRGAEPPCRAYS